VLEAPFIWRDVAHMTRGLDSGDARTLCDELLKARGLRVLASIYTGTRQLTTTDKPVAHPRDLIGLKLRVPPDEVSVAMVEAWQAIPTTVAIPELHAALRQRRIDGQEHPLWVIESLKLSEIQKYLVLTAHLIKPKFLVAAEPFWRGLPDGDRELIQRAISDSLATANTALAKQESEGRDRLAKGTMTVIDPDRAAFVDAFAKDVVPKFAARWGKGRYQRLREIV
jgi:TRAP-type transport system periplasmic protein